MYALLTTLALFALILMLTRVKVPLWTAVLLAAAVVGPLFGLTPGESVRGLADGALEPTTLALLVITVLLLVLSRMMKDSGQMERLVALAGLLLRRPAIAMAALPALIGLLPMPGGALFSAPMVESAAGDTRVPGGQLSAINYWFRHIWEHWWPLYPGVILAMTLSETPLGTFVLCQLPLGVGMAVAGLLLFRETDRELHVRGPKPQPGTWRKLLRTTSSIWIILVVWGAATAAVAAAGPESIPAALRPVVSRYVPITSGLVVSLLWTARLNGTGLRALTSAFATRSPYTMALLVLTIMVFRHMLDISGAASRIAGELTALNIPVELVVMVLPFVAGLVTGLAVGFVGTSFPIVLALVAALPGDVWLAPYVALAYACGHLGQMLSPLHVCHVMSNRYFRTGFGPVYRRILPAAGLALTLAMVYFLVLRWAGLAGD